jgi:acyl-CoA synthetase (AMP-forming)/AMP-acid ligase II
VHGPDHLSGALARSRRLVLPELLARGGRAHPERPALVFGGAARTHAELHDRAARLASALAAAGVRMGDRVALLLHNGFEFPESLLACHRIGACAVPINFRLTADEVGYILEDSGAVALIVGSRPDGLARWPVELEVGPEYEAAIARVTARGAGGGGGARRRAALLHVGHHRTAEGRDPQPRQPRGRHAQLDPRDARGRG